MESFIPHTGCGTQRNIQFITCSIIVAKSLVFPSRHIQGIQRRYFRRGEIVKCGVDMPATVRKNFDEMDPCM